MITKMDAVIRYVLCELGDDAVCRSCPYTGCMGTDYDCRQRLAEDVCRVLTARTENGDPLEQKAARVLRKCGVPENLVGYRYLREAIVIAANEPALADELHNALYPRIAERFGTTPARVERGIRYAIEVRYDRCGPGTVEKLFGSTLSPRKCKPTNSEFITLIADRVRLGQ